MTTLFQCDWCGDKYGDREYVASVDFTIGAHNEKLHACAGCSPDSLSNKFPDETPKFE